MSVRLPPLLFLPFNRDRRSNKTYKGKQTSRDRNETRSGSTVAFHTEKEKGRKMCCHALSSHWNRELATAALTDPLFDQLNGKRSSSIFQHHYNYLAKVSDSAVRQHADEITESISFPKENTFKSFIPQKQPSTKDHCAWHIVLLILRFNVWPL